MRKVETIDDFIAFYPKPVQILLKKVRTTIKKAAPQSEEIISYGIPTFKLNGNLVHFGAYKKHIGFYPGPSAIKNFKEELSGFTTSKGAIQFSLDKPLPLLLISRIVKFRLQENLERAHRKGIIQK